MLQEAGNDLQGVCGGVGSPMHDWSFDQFKHQFVELDSWLNSIQDEYQKGDNNITDRNLRLVCFYFCMKCFIFFKIYTILSLKLFENMFF